MSSTTLSAIRMSVPSLVLVVLLGCTVGPGGVPRASDGAPVVSPADSPVAGPSDARGSGSSGSTGGSTGDGSAASDGPPASDGPVLPPPGSPTLVVPVPGRLQLRPTPATSVDARLVDGRVVARLTWWSGVAPCTVLDTIRVGRTDRRIELAIIEGADRLDVACIEIAMLKSTEVDLGVLAPGSWTISADGSASPVTIAVP